MLVWAISRPRKRTVTLHAVAFGQEFLGVAQLDVEVVDVDAGGHPDLLDLDHALILAGFLLALGLLEPELAVVHKLAYRRGRRWERS